MEDAQTFGMVYGTIPTYDSTNTITITYVHATSYIFKVPYLHSTLSFLIFSEGYLTLNIAVANIAVAATLHLPPLN